MTEPGVAASGQPLLSTPLWLKSPLYLRTYLWIWTQGQPCPQIEDGFDRTLVTTYREMGAALQWVENRALITPTDDQLRPLLGWLEANGFVRVQIAEGTAHATAVDSPHTRSARMAILISVCDLRKWTERAAARALAEAEAADEGKTLPGGIKPKRKQRSRAPRDEWLDDMAANWDQIKPGTKVPYSLFTMWKREYGADIPLDVLRGLASRKRRVYGPLESYLLAAIRNEQKRRLEADTPTGRTLPSVQSVEEDHPPPVSPTCTCEIGWVHSDGGRTPCPNCERGQYWQRKRTGGP